MAENKLPTNAAERKKLPVTTGVLDYFPLAITAVAEVSRVGNEQHNPGQPLHWDRSKSTDHADCLTRHMLERGTMDSDGLPHTAKLAWRALALLQEEMEARADADAPLTYKGVPICAPVRGTGWNTSGLASSRRRCGTRVLVSAPAPEPQMASEVRDQHWVFQSLRQIFQAHLHVTIRNLPATVQELLSKDHERAIRALLGEPPAPPTPPRPCLYIAGPMRGYLNYNFPAFLAADRRARERGWNTLNPAVLDQENGFDPIADYEACEERARNFTPDDWQKIIVRDLGCILALDPSRDGVAMLPGWEGSAGATAEFMLARWRGLRILDARTFEPLRDYKPKHLTGTVADYLATNDV